MKAFLKYSRRYFSTTNNPFHHDFDPGYSPKNTLLNSSLILFDAGRVMGYFLIIFTVIYSIPLHMAFTRRNLHIDNPDYMLDKKAATKV